MPLRVAFLESSVRVDERGKSSTTVVKRRRLSEQASQLVLSFAGAYALQYLPTPVARTGADFTLLEAQRWRLFRIVDVLVKNGVTNCRDVKACFAGFIPKRVGFAGLQALMARDLPVYLARRHALHSFSVRGDHEYTMHTARDRGKEFFAFLEHVMRDVTEGPVKINYRLPSLRSLNRLAKIRGARKRLKVTCAAGRALTAKEVRRYDDAFAEFTSV